MSERSVSLHGGMFDGQVINVKPETKRLVLPCVHSVDFPLDMTGEPMMFYTGRFALYVENSPQTGVFEFSKTSDSAFFDE